MTAARVGERRLRLGIVGAGRATETLHLPALATVPAIEVAALADTDGGTLARVASRFRIAHTSTDPAELVADRTLDAIAVCVPAQAHAGIALAVLDAGKHLFVEKPLALSLVDADAMVARAATAGVVAAVGFNLRWHPQVLRAHAALRAGAVGRIEVIASRITSSHAAVPPWRVARASGGGSFLELAVHHVDLWRWLAADEPVEVSALSRSGERDDETVVLTARFAGGALASACFSDRTVAANTLDVAGRDGAIALSLYRYDGYQAMDVAQRAGRASLAARAWRRVGALPRAFADARRGGTWASSFAGEWTAFAAAVAAHRAGVAGPMPATLLDGRRALAVVLAAIESAGRGTRVVVDPR